MDEQTGTKFVDPIIATAQRYRDVDDNAPRVFYDRTNHRDGFPVADRSVLWVDVTWRKAFAEMPEVARHYATICTARAFAPTVGADPRWSAVEERAALVALQRAEGKKDRVNIFDRNPGIRHMRGRTPLTRY